MSDVMDTSEEAAMEAAFSERLHILGNASGAIVAAFREVFDAGWFAREQYGVKVSDAQLKRIASLIQDARYNTYLYGRNASGTITDLANALEELIESFVIREAEGAQIASRLDA